MEKIQPSLSRFLVFGGEYTCEVATWLNVLVPATAYRQCLELRPRKIFYTLHRERMFFGNTIKENGLPVRHYFRINHAKMHHHWQRWPHLPDVRLFQRGYHVDLGFRKIFSFKRPNINSGFSTNLSGPFYAHQPIGNTVPGLNN